MKTVERDLARTEDVKKLVENYDLVLSAVPGFMGFQILKAVIEARKNVVDIAFFPEDPFLPDDLARTTGYTATLTLRMVARGLYI